MREVVKKFIETLKFEFTSVNFNFIQTNTGAEFFIYPNSEEDEKVPFSIRREIVSFFKGDAYHIGESKKFAFESSILKKRLLYKKVTIQEKSRFEKEEIFIYFFSSKEEGNAMCKERAIELVYKEPELEQLKNEQPDVTSNFEDKPEMRAMFKNINLN